jgi:pilus assembly protein CpaB
MSRKTRAMLVAGFVIFVAGTSGAAYVGTRGSRSAGAATAKAQVLYANRAVDAGTAGSTALASGQIRVRQVDPSAVPSNAVTEASQLSGRVASSAIAAGTTLTTDLFPAPQTRIGTVVIPAGKRALALQLESVPGVAGFVGAGDRIDVYVVSKGNNGAPPGVRLVLQSAEVLNVNGTGLVSQQGQPGGPNLIYLLAVTPAESERLIYLTEFEKLYFDLVPKGEAPVTTPGAGPSQTLQTL